MNGHVHRWRLTESTLASHGVCVTGEAEREFNGGFTSGSVNFAGRKQTPAQLKASNWSRGE